MIELQGIRKRFGELVVLDGVDFQVREGETVALLGPSGTGKSVLLKHIIGLLRPDEGRVLVDDLDVGVLRRNELASLRRRIGYVFQNGALFDSMTVFENIRLGLTDPKRYNDMDYCRERVAQCLALVNLAPETAKSSRRTLGRHAQAGGHCPGDRRGAEVSVVRRADQWPRPRQRGYH